MGVNAYALRSSDAPWVASPVRFARERGHYELARTQTHWNMENRHLVRSASLEKYRDDPDFARKLSHPEDPESIYKPMEYKSYAWAMVIDLGACIGCNACVVGCQSENSIPVVGRDQVARGREMQWVRVDHYYEGADTSNPTIVAQPVPCMHCEMAPCEAVCPVAATVHSDEGINDMVYNRCVGTRFCANNCPYKVRRFNFYQYSDFRTPSLKAGRNPNVTVRQRGVMEKCT